MLLRSGSSELCCQQKMDFKEVDRKEVWRGLGLLATNNVSGEDQGELVHTQLSASAHGLAHHVLLELKIFPETLPPGEGESCVWRS